MTDKPPEHIAGYTLTGSQQYRDDLYAWTQEQLTLMDEGRTAELDMGGIREEIADLAWSCRYVVKHNLIALARTLLVLNYAGISLQKQYGRYWRISGAIYRLHIAHKLKDSPGLRAELPELLGDAYDIARLEAALVLDWRERIFPERRALKSWGSQDASTALARDSSSRRV